MKAQEEVLRRIAAISDDIEDAPDDYVSELKAQKEILEWVLRGDRLPDEYVIEGKLKMSGEFFDEVILAGVDGGGRVYRSASLDEPGQYVLARRPSPEEWEEKKNL